MKAIAHRLLISFLFICANPNSILAQESTYLDGKSYKVNLTQLSGDRRSAWKTDKFIFDVGALYPKKMQKREGFASALCYPSNINTDQDPIIEFTYFNFNKYGSCLKMQGIAQGEVIGGTIRWTSNTGLHTYTFTGTLI